MSVSYTLNMRIAFPYKGAVFYIDNKVYDMMHALIDNVVKCVKMESLCLSRKRKIKYHDLKFSDVFTRPVIDEIVIKNLEDVNQWFYKIIMRVLCEDMSQKWSQAKCNNLNEFCKVFKCIVEVDCFCIEGLQGWRTIYGTDGTEWLSKEYDEKYEQDENGHFKDVPNPEKDECYKQTFDEVIMKNEFADLIVGHDLQDINETSKE